MTEENSRLGTRVPVRIGTPPNDRDALAYIPPPLPLAPPLNLTSMLPLLEQASVALGALNAISLSWSRERLDSLLRIYVSREATFSSQIEGTQTSLQELLLSENIYDDAKTAKLGGNLATRRDDLRETMNYVEALKYGLERLRSSDGAVLDIQLFRELHKRLFLGSTRGADKDPGEFRKVQNYIGGNGFASYVPPPPEQMQACLENLAHQFNNPSPGLPVLVQAAILHAQFEAIHPFLDGNGRVGRLLIGLFLSQCKILHEPILYLSLYFKKHREKYYSSLNRTYAPGGWEAWIEFFLECVRATALDARIRAEKIQKMLDLDHKRLMENPKATKATLAVYDILAEGRIVRASSLAQKLKCTPPPVYQALGILERMGIVREGSGRTNNRWFVYREYMELLNEDTKPFPF